MNPSVFRNPIFYFLLVFHSVLAQAQISVSGANAATTINAATATAVAPDITVTAGTMVTDFTVSIIDSYSPSDVLSYSGTLPSGVVAEPWSTTTRSLVFKGSASASQWQSFLRTVTITSGSVCSPETRKISFAAGETYYNPLNGHFYRLTDTQSSWTNSQNTASSTSYYGREGYLVTLTSDAENTFVSRLVGQNSWMGASDDHTQINNALGYTEYANTNASEGKFYWVTGPERGTQMTTANGNSNYVPGVYQNWRNGEPNDHGSGESFGHVYTGAGDWNDFPNSQSIYGIIEFGDMPNDVTTSEPQYTQEIFIQGSSSGAISGGEVTVCSGTNSTTLTLNGLTGGVVRWESSTNNFITTGTSIANTTTTLNVSNISETTYYRAVVNSTSPSACNGLLTSSTPVFVSEPSPGNVFAENTTICAGSDVELFVSGEEGTIQKWQRSTDNSNWTDIANTETTLTETIANEGTRYYRVLVEIVGCGAPVASASKEITIVNGSAPVGGAVSSAVHGSVTNSGSLSLSGHTGTITKWQQSTDDGIIWSDMSNTTTSYSYTNINMNTLFRAQLTNGSCGTTFSAVGSVVILDPPSITGFTPSVAGNGDVVTISGSGFTGTTGLSFGATSALNFTIVSDTEITATVGTGASGSISVTNPAATDTETGFIYKIAQYDFENNPLDATENNYDGIEINTVTYETGAQGQAICFDDGPGFVQLPDNLIRNLSEFTISLRFKTTRDGTILGYQNEEALNNSLTNFIPIILIDNDGKLKGTLWTGPGNGSIQAISTNVVNDGNWHQVDLVGAANSVAIYLDGNLEANQSGAPVDHLDMSYNQLGLAYTNGYNTTTPTGWEFFNGCIDDMVIVDKALTAQELADITALPAPTITLFTPTESEQGASVTITGTNFDGATQVTFGGIDAASFTVDSNSQITAVLASGASGDVTVTTAGGTATSTSFTYVVQNTAPTVTSTSITSATAQSLYYYDIKASDADNDVITWTANTVPTWLTFTSGTLQTSFVGTGATPTNTGDGVNQSPDGTSASTTVIQTGAAAHGANKLFFTDTEEYGIRYVDANGTVQTWYQGDGTFTNLNPVGIAYDAVNNAVYVGDYAKTDIVKIDNTGTRTLLSNLPEPFMFRLLVNANGTRLYASARGGIYEIDLTNNDPNTNWTRVVGTGTMGYSDTGTASTSQVNQPHGMAFDSAGRLVFTDRSNDIIRRVNLVTDTIETIAGTQGAGTEAGNGGSAINATFADPSGLVINEHDEIFISERLSKRIRKIDTNGDIDTFFTVAAGGFADDLVISEAGELFLLTSTLIAQVATKAELTGTPTNADAGVHNVALTLSDGMDNVPYNFQITVEAVNYVPTDITLDTNSINQSATGASATVGTLSTTDADSADSHTYSLVAGTGDIHNASFNINGATLRTNSALAAGNYNIRINTNDGTDDFAKEFTVNVLDDVAPEGYRVSIDQDPIDSSNQTSINFTFAGAAIGTTYNYSFDSDNGGTRVTGTGTITSATDQITAIDLSGLADGLITLTVTLTDSSGNEGNPVQDSATKIWIRTMMVFRMTLTTALSMQMQTNWIRIMTEKAMYAIPTTITTVPRIRKMPSL